MERYQSVTVGGVTLGDGIPKICVPIVAADRDSVLREAEGTRVLPAELVEWRVDCLDDPREASGILPEVIAVLDGRPLLVTFRSKREGGSREFSKEEYLQLNRELLAAGGFALLDVELFTGEEEVRELIGEAHRADVRVVLSSHAFAHTPPNEEMLSRLCRMQELGGDISKLAVMPRTAEDVTRLLAVSAAMRERYANRPFITMSMGALGVLSRIGGALTGSAVTFGSAAAASAPGQMEAEELAEVLRLVGKGMRE